MTKYDIIETFYNTLPCLILIVLFFLIFQIVVTVSTHHRSIPENKTEAVIVSK